MVESTPLTNAGVEFWSTSDICNVETVGICMGLHIYCIESCTIMQKWSWCDEMYAAYTQWRTSIILALLQQQRNFKISQSAMEKGSKHWKMLNWCFKMYMFIYKTFWIKFCMVVKSSRPCNWLRQQAIQTILIHMARVTSACILLHISKNELLIIKFVLNFVLLKITELYAISIYIYIPIYSVFIIEQQTWAATSTCAISFASCNF